MNEGICIEEDCKKYRLLCQQCILESHENHRIINDQTFEDFNDQKIETVIGDELCRLFFGIQKSIY